MRIAITGAGGKTGRAVTAAVRDAGHDAVPVVRRPQGIDGERMADLDDAAAMSDALSDADALYLIAPNVHPDEVGLLRPTLDLCEQAGMRVVYHSVMHPHVRQMPHHLDKADVEALLRQSTLEWSILQPASYMDNVTAPIAAAVDGTWRQPYDVRTPFTPIALDDLAAAAARVLGDGAFTYGTYELAGPDRLTSQEMAATVARVLDRQLEVVADRAGWEEQAGSAMDAEAARRLGLMFDYYDVHGFAGNPQVLGWLLGRQPVTFEEWVRRNRAALGYS